MFTRFFHIILFVSISQYCAAQNIAGTWEGLMDDDEWLQINVEQQQNEICGYTYDHLLANRADYCRATFSGKYDKAKEMWTLTGTGFIENSGRHTLMIIRLWRDPSDEPDVLRGRTVVKTFLGFLSVLGSDIRLKKISSRADMSYMSETCFPKKEEIKEPKIIDTIPAITKVPPPKSPAKDTIVAFNKPMPDSVRIATGMKERKQNEQGHLKIKTDVVNLKLYDNGVVDNDTVSVFYNGKLLVSHQRLSEKAIELNISLDKNTTRHEIILFAENLGGIPPNTALVVVTAGGQRYELRSKASLEENAVLIIENGEAVRNE